MKLSNKGYEFLKSYETLHDGDLTSVGLQPKLDAAGIWTEGYGHAMVKDGKFLTKKYYPNLSDILKFSTVSSIQQANELLLKDVAIRENLLNKSLIVQLSQNEFDALLLHTFNCGKSETLYNMINTNIPAPTLKDWWVNHYITSGGKTLKGLKLRRMDEWEIWEKNEYLRNYNLERVI